MKRYCIKSHPGRFEYVDILMETEEGYKIKLTRICDGDEKTREEFIDRHLFDICVKTGYLSELTQAELGVFAA